MGEMRILLWEERNQNFGMTFLVPKLHQLSTPHKDSTSVCANSDIFRFPNSQRGENLMFENFENLCSVTAFTNPFDASCGFS